MNYHIIPQETFFFQYIEDIYTLGLEDNNQIWVRGKKGESPYFHTNRKVTYIGDDVAEWVVWLRKIKPMDKLFISWYDMDIGQAVIESKIATPIYVYLMGGDFYADPYSYHDDWLYDKYTKRIIWRPRIKFRKNPLHWGRLFADISQIIDSRRKTKEAFQKKLQYVERIDFLVLPKGDNAEYNLIKHLYPTLRAPMVFGTFDQNFDLAKIQNVKSVPSAPLKVLVGNSCDPTNNHIDVFRFIKSHFHRVVDVFSALSYGDDTERKIAIKEGYNCFGSHFHPITDYMDRNDYIKFLNEIDVVIMYHNRQQAVGNIITSLVLGKPVFMKKNVVYSFLKENGITPVYDIANIRKLSIEDCIEEAKAMRPKTIEIIQDMYSAKRRLEYLSNLLQ